MTGISASGSLVSSLMIHIHSFSNRWTAAALKSIQTEIHTDQVILPPLCNRGYLGNNEVVQECVCVVGEREDMLLEMSVYGTVPESDTSLFSLKHSQ